MSRVLLAIGALIVLAAAAFAIFHFTSRPKEQTASAASASQNGWVPVATTVPSNGPMHVAGTFGAWRLLCRSDDAPMVVPGMSGAPDRLQSRCVVALAMRRAGVRKEGLNFRLASVPFGRGLTASFAMIAYRNPNPGAIFRAEHGSKGKEVDLLADKKTVTLYTQRCGNGGCFARSQIAQPELDSIVSARNLAVDLDPAEQTDAHKVTLPTNGLKAAYAALRKQQPIGSASPW